MQTTAIDKLQEAFEKHKAVMSKYDTSHLRNYGELKEVQDSQNELLEAIVNALV